MTTHINARPGDFAPVVLMPGDPLRARYIAESFLEDAVEVSNLRNVLGFTGTYDGTRLSVMASGMGIPSISIYSHELITEFGVDTIIRVGSCGTVLPNVKMRDLVIGLGACTDSSVNRSRFMGYDFAAIADFGLVSSAVELARDINVDCHVGNIFSADLFYTTDTRVFDLMEKYRVLGVEMEAAGLYSVAAEHGARAVSICSVTDHIRKGTALSGEERQNSLNDGILLSLQTAVAASRNRT